MAEQDSPHETIVLSKEVDDFLRTVVKSIHPDAAVAETWLPVLREAIQRWVIGDTSSFIELPTGFTFEGESTAPVWWLWEEQSLAIIESDVRHDNGFPELPWRPLADSIDPELWEEWS